MEYESCPAYWNSSPAVHRAHSGIPFYAHLSHVGSVRLRFRRAVLSRVFAGHNFASGNTLRTIPLAFHLLLLLDMGGVSFVDHAEYANALP